jgi:hypothetical protein
MRKVAAKPSSKKRRRWLQAIVASIWLIQIPGASLAEQPPTAAARETARALMQEGDQLSAAGKHADALKNYLAAHALVRIPPTGLEVARSQVKLGQLVEARGLAMEMANSAPIPGEPPVYARARSAAAELAKDLGPRIPSIRTVVTPEARHTLTIDGQILPTEAQAIAFRLNPGKHTLVIAASGFITQRKEVLLAERQAAVVTIQLQPAQANKGPGPTPAPGTASRRN